MRSGVDDPSGGQEPPPAQAPKHGFLSEPEDGQLQRQRRWRSACPFTVHRTQSDNVPVYVFHRKNRTEQITVIRKVRGSAEDLRRELAYLCRAPVSYNSSGCLQVVGNHRRIIKAYLRSIGY